MTSCYRAMILTLLVQASGCGNSSGCQIDAEFREPIDAGKSHARIEVQFRNIGEGVCGARNVQLVALTAHGERAMGSRRIAPLAARDFVLVAWPAPDASRVELRGEGLRPISKRVSGTAVSGLRGAPACPGAARNARRKPRSRDEPPTAPRGDAC